MNIIMVTATDTEIAIFREHYLNNADTRYPGLSIRFLTTGVGLVATAVKLSKALSAGLPDLLIQAGIGGCFQNNTDLGAVYTVSDDCIADLGVQEDGEWKDVFDLGLAKDDAAPFQDRRLVAPAPQAAFGKLKSVQAISVNEITTSVQRAEQIRAKYNPVLESMEGAAFHFVALEYGVPFMQVRAVSNYIGERNKKNWMMKDAIVNLNEVLKNAMQVMEK